MKFHLLIWILATTTLLVACHQAPQVGDFYSAHGVKGVVVSLNDEGCPSLLLSLEEAANMDADSALRWCSSQMGEGWCLPNKGQLELLARHRDVINASLQRKNLPELMVGSTWYWSSTPCRDLACDSCDYSHVYAHGPDGVRCYFRENSSPAYRVRPVMVLD